MFFADLMFFVKLKHLFFVTILGAICKLPGLGALLVQGASAPKL